MKKEYDFSKGRRGAVLPVSPGKSRITIRIDDDVLEWFRKQVQKAGGGSYQALINRALRDHIEGEAESIEDTLRRVLEEVLPGSGKSRAKPKPKKSKAKRKSSKRKAG